MSPPRLMICPFCGHTQRPAERCQDCGTAFDAAARKATIARMGPWFVRDSERSFLPGCTYDALRSLVDEGRVGRYTIVRGPTTRQLWTVARHVPGLAHLLGYCHACDAPVNPGDAGCHHCGASFTASADRDSLGLEVGEAEGAGRPLTQGRSVGFVPTQGLSAFASDEELMVGAGPMTGARRGPLAAEAGPAQASAQAAPLSSASEPRRPAHLVEGPAGLGRDGAALHASIERSLRSALRRQRLLSAFLLGLVIALFAASAWMFMRLRAEERVPPTPAPAEAAAPQAHLPGGASSASTPAPAAPGAEAPPAAPQRSVQAIAEAIEALAMDRTADPESRRARLAALESELAAASSGAGPASDAGVLQSLRERLEAVRAQIELDAVLPPE